MECLRCTRQPLSVFRPSKVLFAVATAHHAPFVESVFSEWNSATKSIKHIMR